MSRCRCCDKRLNSYELVKKNKHNEFQDLCKFCASSVNHTANIFDVEDDWYSVTRVRDNLFKRVDKK